MAKTPPDVVTGPAGELHERATTAAQALTTNQGVPVGDDQTSLKLGARGPTLLEDFHFREKIMHFDHERIPERVVHARGSAAHGYFQVDRSMAHLTRAAFLQDPAVKTPVFVRFSTVAGGAGSVDTPRDVRGFAVKFYTSEGVFDLVGNNIPIFFIQDAMKFPDLVHAVKMEPDRGFPQAASAHDTFWDFISRMPESIHMVMWAMSDRTIPRSLRMMEGFGIHTFRLVDRAGKSTFVKFHWRPEHGSQSTLWDEAVKIAGADPDYTRRDLWEAINDGNYPSWELCFQVFDEAQAQKLAFDVLDPTKLIPEEVIPLEKVGRLVLDRNPDNFFAETEQAAFHPGHVVPGIDFTNDPLLQGRLFSYLDTQLSRLGGPNFHELPINRSKSPVRNHQRDGHMRFTVDQGQTAYEPGQLEPETPRESAEGYVSYAEPGQGDKLRRRPESFADHYSQARLFWKSQTEVEQGHIVRAYVFELGKVMNLDVRRRMLGHLDVVAPELGQRVATGLGLVGKAIPARPARPPIDLPASPTLSLLHKAQDTLAGRKLAVLVSDGVDDEALAALGKLVSEQQAKLAVVGPHPGMVKTASGRDLAVDHAVDGAPSCLFDAALLATSIDGARLLAGDAVALAWVRDAFAHCKVIGYTESSAALVLAANVSGEGVIEVKDGWGGVIEAARKGRVWSREKTLRPPL